MQEKVIWTRPAQQNLANVFKYLVAENSAEAFAIIGRIENAAEWLQHFPWLGTEVNSQLIRRLLAPHTKFYLVYKIKDASIEILAVYHTAQEFSS